MYFSKKKKKLLINRRLFSISTPCNAKFSRNYYIKFIVEYS